MPLKVVGVSLGSSRRDHEASLTLAGRDVLIARRGVDGDFARAADLLRSLDGTVDAIGLGGIDRWLVLDGRRYAIRDAETLVRSVSKTPVVDGSGLKAAWEPAVIRRLIAGGRIDPSQRVLMVSALDRFGMADAFYRAGFPTVAGDLMFAARIDYPIRSREELIELGERLLPEFVTRPFGELYPVGEEQEAEPDPRYARYFDSAEIVAGDFHLIRRYLPESLGGKIVITNTTTASDLDLLAERGARLVITTTPVVDGRSFGTNVVEAAVVAVTGLFPDDPGWAETVAGLGLRYGERWLQGHAPD